MRWIGLQLRGAVLQDLRESRIVLQRTLTQLRDDIGGIAEQLTGLMQVKHRNVIAGGGQPFYQLVKQLQLFDHIGVAQLDRIESGGGQQLIGFTFNQQGTLQHILRILHPYQPFLSQLPDRRIRPVQCNHGGNSTRQYQQHQHRQRKHELPAQRLR